MNESAMPKSNRFKAACVCLVACLITGCQPINDWLTRPAGTRDQQRLRAALHDPYALPDVAPGSEQVRPPGFAKPLAEPVRNRYLHDSYWHGQRE